MIVKTVVTDVDGVMTPGNFLYDDVGKRMKEFGPHDADGVKLLRDAGVHVIAITADERGIAITKRRMTDMGLDLFVVSEKDRLSVLKKEYDRASTVFVGDGYHDAPALAWFNRSYAPADACKRALTSAKHVLKTMGGRGVLLEVALDVLRDERSSTYETILDELQQFKPTFTSNAYDEIVNEIAQQIREGCPIIGIAAGRMGFVLRAFIMRLGHLGASATMIGDTTVPTCDENTLVIINSSSGETPSIALFARQAKNAGSRLIVVTTQPESTIAQLADIRLDYPTIESRQMMKTAYEQFTFLLFDAIVADIRQCFEANDEIIRQRHSILE